MNTREAILSFAQSEKAKSGLLMAAQLVELYNGLPEHDRHSADRILRTLVGMIANEIHLSRKMSPLELWNDVEKSLSTALVMMNSGVMSEAGYHIALAVSSATTIGQRSMEHLIAEKLL